MKYAVLVVSLLFSLAVLAEGGKNRKQNPVLVGECSYVTPGVIDTSNCDEVPAPDQSGVTVLICEGLVICTDTESNDD